MSYERLPKRTAIDVNAAADVNLLQSNFDAIVGGTAPNNTINVLNSSISTLTTSISTETASRISGDTALSGRIDNIGISGGLLNQIFKNNGLGAGSWGTVTENSGALANITTISMSQQFTNTLAIGTVPFVITSTTKVSNLNVDAVDDAHKSTDTTFAADSDLLIPSQKAVKYYVDAETIARTTSTGLINDYVNNTFIPLSEKGTSNGVASLTSTGKIYSNQLPSLVITDTYVVNSEYSMLNLTLAEQGDIAIRTDITKTFILTADPYSELSNWQEILFDDTSNSKYIVQEADPKIPNAQPLNTLITGILKSTTSTGVVSIASEGVDYLGPYGDGSHLTGIDALPNQTGQNGKYLRTSSGTAYWDIISDITSGDLTPGTGLSVIGGTGAVLTSTGATIGIASGYYLPTTTDQSNWNSTSGESHSHSNKATLDVINQNLSMSDLPTFAGLTIGTSTGIVKTSSGIFTFHSTISHNNDTDVSQGGNSSERYHLTNAQHTIATQAASLSQHGYLTSSGYATFSSKQDALINSAGLAAALSDETGTGLAVFNDDPTITDVTISDLNRNFVTYGTDTKHSTGIPYDERIKFRIEVTYSAPNVDVSLVFNGAYTSFSYYINGKKYTVTDLTPFTNKTAIAAEGVWFCYINNLDVFTLTQDPWLTYNPDVLMWNFYFNATANTITWIGEERHTAGRDIFQHARNHSQGAIYKTGFAFSQYNGLTALSSNTNNNYGRAMAQFSNGSFFDEDILNKINHLDTAITSTTTSPSTDWNLNTNQFLGFTALADTGTNTTTIVFPTSRTLVIDQAIAVMTGNSTTIRGITTISAGGTGTTFTVNSVTGMTTGDAIVVSARIPIYYITSTAPYVWRKLTATDFLGVHGGAGITAANIATATAQYNNTAGGFTNMAANRYYPIYIIATNMTSEPVIAILGQGQSTNATLATALGENAFQFQNLVGLSALNIQEVVPIYRLTFHYNTSVAFNVSHIRLVDQTFINIRVSTATAVVNNPVITSLPAGSITTDTTNFNKILSASDSSVEAALDTLDDHTHNSHNGLYGDSPYYHLSSTGYTNSHSPYVLGTKTVNESGIGNGKILSYNTSTGELVYASDISGGDMYKSTYDSNDDGIVNSADNADTVDGKHASEFSSTGHLHDDRYYTENEVDAKFTSTGITFGDLTTSTGLSVSGGTGAVKGSGVIISHLDTAGNKHVPTGGSSNQILKNSGSSGTGSWGTVTENSGALGSVTTLGMSGQLTNTLATGTAPFVITSSTGITNLNADMLDTAHKSTDGTLATNSDALIPSEKAVKTYVDNNSGGVSPLLVMGA